VVSRVFADWHGIWRQARASRLRTLPRDRERRSHAHQGEVKRHLRAEVSWILKELLPATRSWMLPKSSTTSDDTKAALLHGYGDRGRRRHRSETLDLYHPYFAPELWCWTAQMGNEQPLEAARERQPPMSLDERMRRKLQCEFARLVIFLALHRHNVQRIGSTRDAATRDHPINGAIVP